jgi:hypothetical protein
MKTIHISKALLTLLTLASSSIALIGVTQASSANTGKDAGTNNYRAACISKQVQMHEKLKNVPPEAFHSYCDCTSKFLLNNLNQSQLSELSKGGKKPSWLPAVEKSAAEACLAPMPKLQV